LAARYWKTASSRTKRILTIVAFLIIAIIVTSIGAVTPLSNQEADSINHELNKTRENASVQYIFGNNLMICLLMFVPIVGPILGMWVLYNTGLVIAAESMLPSMHGIPPLLVLFTLLVFPFAWLEFLSYSTAFAESVWLVRRIQQGRTRRELRNAAILIAIVTVALLLAAIIEMAMIMLLGG